MTNKRLHANTLAYNTLSDSGLHANSLELIVLNDPFHANVLGHKVLTVHANTLACIMSALCKH